MVPILRKRLVPRIRHAGYLRVLSQQLPYLNLVGFEGGWLRGTGDRNRGNVAPYLFRSTAATHIYVGGRVDALRFLEC
jgi:hypothetical protein